MLTSIAHEVLEEEDVIRQIADRFGADVLDADGRIRRRAVADRVFGPTPDHARALEWLERNRAASRAPPDRG
jgi:dephospho-CoA kinase